ncbi:TBC1 domain family member 20 [Prorops nasuta]|uniref:TBC1 domain family member 20 n=1 Tax=Prorops nasuta TaxID=863751 RepID=UPI0034CF278F
MNTEEEQTSLISSSSDVSAKNAVSNEKFNLKKRRKNATENSNFNNQTDNSVDLRKEIPLVLLPDSTRVWTDEELSKIPEIIDSGHIEKQNGVIGFDENHHQSVNVTAGKDMQQNREHMKICIIRDIIGKLDFTLGELRKLGRSSEGLVNDDIRRVLWPKMLRLSKEEPVSEDKLNIIHTCIPNDVYQQILKDVARSGSHIGENAKEEDTKVFHEELTRLICWVLHKNPDLNYYQGYNDIAATVLIVMGLQRGLYILESLSLEFLERFMEETMERVNQELFYIFALLERIHPNLLEHLENVELFPHFALAEYTTWYAHKYAENRKLLHRLFDYFLSSPQLMPLYLSTVIVAHRATEIFNTTPDMGHTHKVLCTLPEDLPFEKLLNDAQKLYRDYPPESIVNDVTDYDHRRRCKEQEWKVKAEASRHERERQQQLKLVRSTPRIPYRIKSYKTITVVTILALGLYAFLKSSSGLN